MRGFGHSCELCCCLSRTESLTDLSSSNCRPDKWAAWFSTGYTSLGHVLLKICFTFLEAAFRGRRGGSCPPLRISQKTHRRPSVIWGWFAFLFTSPKQRLGLSKENQTETKQTLGVSFAFLNLKCSNRISLGVLLLLVPFWVFGQAKRTPFNIHCVGESTISRQLYFSPRNASCVPLRFPVPQGSPTRNHTLFTRITEKLTARKKESPRPTARVIS